MTYQTPPPHSPDATLDQVARAMESMMTMAQTGANAAGDALINLIYPAIDQATQLAGTTVAPIA